MTRMTDEQLVEKVRRGWGELRLTATERARFDLELWEKAEGNRSTWRAPLGGAVVVAGLGLALAVAAVLPERPEIGTSVSRTAAHAEVAGDADWDEWLGLAVPVKWGDVPEDLPVEYQALAYWLGPSEEQ